MEMVSLALLLGAIAVFDEIFNGQMKVSRRLLRWLDRQPASKKPLRSK